MVFGGDLQKYRDALLESLRVLLPQQVMQKNSHGVQSQRFGPAEFLVNFFGVEAVGLPHLQFIYRGSRDEIAAH